MHCNQSDLHQLYADYNDTDYDHPTGITWVDLFRQQVKERPEQTAIKFRESTLSYRELDERSNQVANLLREKGLGSGDFVGLCFERSLEMMIALYGIVKAGAAYLPLAPDTPSQRLRYLIEDARLQLILTSSDQCLKLSDLPTQIQAIDDESLSEFAREYTGPSPTPNDLMYLIYTSGSTGNPKGVMVEHAAVVNRLLWMHRAYPITPEDTILQKTPVVFDVSVWELFWWSMVGSQMCLLGPGHEKFPQAIVHEIERSDITTLHFVPSMFNMFLGYLEQLDDLSSLATLKYVFCSGEALQAAYVNRFNSLFDHHDVRLINLYGPTEATVDVTFYNCPKQTTLSAVPIGRPIDNVRLYVIKDDQLVGPDEEGELMIAGDCLARGYLNRPELTGEMFLEHHPAIPERVYRSGDLVKLRHDGEIEYINRTDFQVKIRGLRIELGEIENTVMNFTGVRQCLVLIKNQETINPQLVACLLTGQSIDHTELKTFLRGQLPAYMVPAKYVEFEEFPLNQNGKADRRHLMTLI